MISPIGFKSTNINNEKQSSTGMKAQQNGASKGSTKGYHLDEDVLNAIENGHDKILSNDPITKSRIFSEKLLNAFTRYPVKGMKGSQNSNFYEFLTMGMVPYTIGSLMLMGVFNTCSKYFKPFATQKAATIGHKMAMGVLLYGLFKSASKKLIELPVLAATGIDVNTAYRSKKSQLPEKKDDPDNKKANEYHKVYESVDFPRWDLLYGKAAEGNINQYYDRIAKKLGYGENLLDSDQQVKNDIKETVVRTKVATTLASCAWGALGVSLAMQDDWLKIMSNHGAKPFALCKSREPFLSLAYFKEIPERVGTFVEIVKHRFFTKDAIKTMGLAVKRSCKSLYDGGEHPTKLSSIGGKAIVWGTAALTVFGAVNAMFNFHKKDTTCKEAEINYNEDYTVN